MISMLYLLLLPLLTTAINIKSQYVNNIRRVPFEGVADRAVFGFNDEIFIEGTLQNGCRQIYQTSLQQPEKLVKVSPGIGNAHSIVPLPDGGFYLISDLHETSVSLHECPKPLADIRRSDVFKVNEYGNIVKKITNEPSFKHDLISIGNSKDSYLFVSDNHIWKYENESLEQLTSFEAENKAPSVTRNGRKLVFVRKISDEGSRGRHLFISVNLKDKSVDFEHVSEEFFDVEGPFLHVEDDAYLFIGSKDGISYNLYMKRDSSKDVEQITSGQEVIENLSISPSGKRLSFVVDNKVYVADWAGLTRERTNRVQVGQDDAKTTASPGRWQDQPTKPYDGIVHFQGEKHFRNVKQLTFQGENAEGYFSFDDSKLTLQATGYGTDCDQIYELDLNTDPRQNTMRRISTGLGGTTCSFFYKEIDNNHRLYAGNFWNVSSSTYPDITKTCPPKKCADPATITDPELKSLCNTSYTWDIVPDYDIFKVDKYGNLVQRLTNSAGYDAEGVVSPDGTKIAFTSIRSGDLELWIMNIDGTNPVQLTDALGYDGGSFFSPDGKRLIFRASRPNTTEEIAKYKKLLTYNLVEPIAMELFVIDIDGKNMRQITHLGQANWAPYYLNDNKRIVFSSNYDDAANGFGAFALYVINDDGTGLERLTYGDKWQFNSFAMMNYEGTKLVWGSSRNGSSEYDLNLFIADWIDEEPTTKPSNAPTTHAPVATTKLGGFTGFYVAQFVYIVITYLLW